MLCTLPHATIRFTPDLVSGALMYWEGHEQVGFVVRPPGGMWQTLEPGKPESAHMTSARFHILNRTYRTNVQDLIKGIGHFVNQ